MYLSYRSAVGTCTLSQYTTGDTVLVERSLKYKGIVNHGNVLSMMALVEWVDLIIAFKFCLIWPKKILILSQTAIYLFDNVTPRSVRSKIRHINPGCCLTGLIVCSEMAGYYWRACDFRIKHRIFIN